MVAEGIKIFLAEDDPDDVFFFEDALQEVSASSTLTVCQSGCELLDKLSGDGEIRGIIFLDVNMPRMDGMECLQKIRSKHNLQNIPVVMLTTCGLDSTIERAFKLGAGLFVVKPYSMQDLQNMIERVLKMNWADKRNQMQKRDFIYRVR